MDAIAHIRTAGKSVVSVTVPGVDRDSPRAIAEAALRIAFPDAKRRDKAAQPAPWELVSNVDAGGQVLTPAMIKAEDGKVPDRAAFLAHLDVQGEGLLYPPLQLVRYVEMALGVEVAPRGHDLLDLPHGGTLRLPGWAARLLDVHDGLTGREIRWLLDGAAAETANDQAQATSVVFAA